MNIIVTCEECKAPFEHKKKNLNSNKKFCADCLQRHKDEHKDLAKKFHQERSRVVGRPRNTEEYFYGSQDMKFTWDETLDCGGLL